MRGSLTQIHMRFLRNPPIFVHLGVQNKGQSGRTCSVFIPEAERSCQCWASSLLTEEIQHADNICAPFLSELFIIVFPNIACYLVPIRNDEWSNKKRKKERNEMISFFDISFFFRLSSGSDSIIYCFPFKTISKSFKFIFVPSSNQHSPWAWDEIKKKAKNPSPHPPVPRTPIPGIYPLPLFWRSLVF